MILQNYIKLLVGYYVFQCGFVKRFDYYSLAVLFVRTYEGRATIRFKKT